MTDLIPGTHRRVLQRPNVETVKGVFGNYPAGVAAICAQIDQVKRGLVATSFTVGVSLEPPMVLFSVQNISSTWPELRRAERIGISVLGAQHEELCMRLASKSPDKFVGLDLCAGGSEAVFVPDAPAWLECSVVSETPAGDHTVVIFEVLGIRSRPDHLPLIYQARKFGTLVATS